MSFYYGFYNSNEGDRKYDALDVSRLFDGLIRDGVFAGVGDHFIVRAAANRYDTVIIGSGRAWFNHTWNYNDADLFFVGERSELIYDRIDAIVIDIQQEETIRHNQILWITGTPGNDPKKPALIHDEEAEHYQYPLCYIRRPANSDYIEQAHIENAIGTSECPFVIGIPNEIVNADDLLLQWKDQWEKWLFGSKEDFINWFEMLRYVLDGDVAGHLQNEIDMLDLKVAKLVLEGTLKAGSTDISFAHRHILDTSMIDIYVLDHWGVSPETVETSNGTIKMTFEVQDTDMKVRVVVKDLDRGVFT